MKSQIPTAGTRAGGLLAALLLPASALLGQTITNPSFETDTTFNTFPGYISSGTNGPITGWTGTPTSRVGLNPSDGSPFADNGAIPNGTKVAFIQNGVGGGATLSTTITGLTVDTKYKVTFRINARGINTPHLQFSTDGTGAPVSMEVTQVGGTNPYRYAACEFTATAETQTLTLTNTRTTGDHTVIVDDFQITPSDNAWATAPWTGDEDSGIDSQYTYTHAVNFANNSGVTINGVHFIGREFDLPGRTTYTGLNQGFGNRTPNNVTGNSNFLAKDFRYNGTPSIKLENLKPNTEYVFTLYGIGFDEFVQTGYPHRSATFSSDVPGSQRFTANLNQFGWGNGTRVTYTYTTDALGTPVTINYPSTGAGTFHSSGFSNREADPNLTPSPWSAIAWSDDASSGIDSTYLYTHAYNLGAATNVHVNGVNFTGIGGINPAAGNLTTTLPTGGPADTNNISGYSSALGTSFVYNGFPGAFNLTGLTPGKEYVLTLFSVGWDPDARNIKFFGLPGDASEMFNQNLFGNDNGIRIEYTYTAPASGNLTVHASSFDGGRSLHSYALANREADPLVDVAPTVTLDPVSATIPVGGNHTFRAGATGSGTLNYQWKLDGDIIPGATNPILNLTEVGYDQTGEYTCTITNSVDEITTAAATLSVRDRIPGLFNTGLGHNGLPLPHGAVDPHYTLIVNPDNTESTAAIAQVTGIPGAWVANNATSSWIGPRANTFAATGVPVNAGEGEGTYVYRTQFDLTNFDLASVQITGLWSSDNAGIQIRVNGVSIGFPNDVGLTFSNLVPFTINQVTATNLVQGVNTLDFVIQNAAVGYTGLRVQNLSATGVLPPDTAPHIAVQPANTIMGHNQTALLGVDVSGSWPFTYQWFFNNEELIGEDGPTLAVTSFDYSQAGNYKVVVTNAADSVESNVAIVSIPNANPVAITDNFETNFNESLELDVLDLILNDSDPDGDFFDFESVSPTSAEGGTVSESLGTITYTPPPGFSGTDSFTYTINDGIWGGTGIGTVQITVLPPPVPEQLGPVTLTLNGGTVNASFTGTEGSTYTFQRSTTLNNDWIDLDTQIAPPGGLIEFEDTNPPPGGRAFYRVVVPETPPS